MLHSDNDTSLKNFKLGLADLMKQVIVLYPLTFTEFSSILFNKLLIKLETIH